MIKLNSVQEYIKVYGSFDSFGYDMDDEELIAACEKALKEDRKVTTRDLYPEGVTV